MPFTKIKKGKNRGKFKHGRRVYTTKQVKAYYATGGFRRKPRKRR